MNANEIFVVNGFKGTSKKTGKEFCGVNAITQSPNGLDTRLLFTTPELLEYVQSKGSGYYRYNLGFGGFVSGLELVKPVAL